MTTREEGAAQALDEPARAPAVRWSRFGALALAAAAAVGLVAGWRLFEFLTDDAYIAFRYVANDLAGRGLVWNPAPFQPVEGYTSWLWVVLLRETWRLTGAEPPLAANFLALACGAATLVLTALWVARLDLPERLARARGLLLGVVLLGTLTNRTFLAWLSSGLETALFNLLFTWWLYEALTPPARRGRFWGPRLAVAAALAALARPDGLLAAAGTVAVLALAWHARQLTALAALAAAAPLAAVPLHLLWRRSTYGDWLPNTYFAKHLGAWPGSGLRYLGSFVLEYGLWLWLVFGLVAWIAAGRPGARRAGAALRSAPHAAAALAVVFGHLGYYVLLVGGDHFEFRVLSHLVPWLFLAALWLLARTRLRAGEAVIALLSLVVVSWPIPWLHWQATHRLATRAETYRLVEPLADRFAWPLRPGVALWDRWQAWLIRHSVGMRHQEHKIFHDTLVAELPPRAAGELLSWGERPVIAAPCVGVLGWVLPNVAVIDRFGLNDRVIARGPVIVEFGDQRQMAHDRHAPPGYVKCFRPNVEIVAREARVTPRAPPLGDDEIRACEEREWRYFAAERPPG